MLTWTSSVEFHSWLQCQAFLFARGLEGRVIILFVLGRINGKSRKRSLDFLYLLAISLIVSGWLWACLLWPDLNWICAFEQYTTFTVPIRGFCWSIKRNLTGTNGWR